MGRLYIYILLLSCSNLLAQTNDEKSIEKITIESSILSEKRELIIALPKNYSDKKSYPVSYVLDGESLFEGHKDVVEYLSAKNVIPEMIIVGIVNGNRSLNFTHVKDTSSNFTPNGGGKQFESFLTQELIPFIEKEYSTAPYRIISGHSVSGLFAAKLLLNSSDLFNAYLILDPALWWKEMEILLNAEVQLKNSTLENKKVFLSAANSLPEDIQEVDLALKDTSNATLGFRSVFEFKEALNTSDSKKQFWQFKYYEEESHGTVPFISNYDGMKFIFNFYKRPSFQTLTDSSHLVLDKHYKTLSNKMGYTILPPVNELNGFAWRCQVLDKNNNRTYNFLKLYETYYPTDSIVYIRLAEHFELIGEMKKSKNYYKKGIELGYDSSEN